MIRCLLCQTISFSHICKVCQHTFLKPTLTTRVLADDFQVFSFYRYSDIATLLKTKHTHIGAGVYAILAYNSMRLFAHNFSFESMVYAVGVDDHVGHGYSHTAILSKSLKSKHITPLFSKLRAQTNVQYSTKSLAYRLANPRGFVYHDNNLKDVIIVDDIITTGTTILEAKMSIEKTSSSPLFAITLADAKDT